MERLKEVEKLILEKQELNSLLKEIEYGDVRIVTNDIDYKIDSKLKNYLGLTLNRIINENEEKTKRNFKD